MTIDWDAQKNFEFEYQIGMVDEFPYELSTKVKVQSYPIEVDQKTIDETVSDLKKRFGKVSYPETSEADDNLFGPLKAVEGDFAREQAFIAVDKVEKKEQKKFVGVKKGEAIEFDIDKVFNDTDLKAQVLGMSTEEAKSVKGKYTLTVETISRTEPAELNIGLFDRAFGKDAVTDEAGFIAKIKETIGENYKRESEHFLSTTSKIILSPIPPSTCPMIF